MPIVACFFMRGPSSALTARDAISAKSTVIWSKRFLLYVKCSTDNWIRDSMTVGPRSKGAGESACGQKHRASATQGRLLQSHAARVGVGCTCMGPVRPLAVCCCGLCRRPFLTCPGRRRDRRGQKQVKRVVFLLTTAKRYMSPPRRDDQLHDSTLWWVLWLRYRMRKLALWHMCAWQSRAAAAGCAPAGPAHTQLAPHQMTSGNPSSIEAYTCTLTPLCTALRAAGSFSIADLAVIADYISVVPCSGVWGGKRGVEAA